MASKWIEISIAVVGIYCVLALGAFRFQHPQMTETELFLHIPEALTWRDVPASIAVDGRGDE